MDSRTVGRREYNSGLFSIRRKENISSEWKNEESGSERETLISK